MASRSAKCRKRRKLYEDSLRAANDISNSLLSVENVQHESNVILDLSNADEVTTPERVTTEHPGSATRTAVDNLNISLEEDSAHACTEQEDILSSDYDDSASDCSTDSDIEPFDENSNLSPGKIRPLLAEWAVVNHISHAALRALLALLVPIIPDLPKPKDPRTLLKTGTCSAVKAVSGGYYHHYGVASNLRAIITESSQLMELDSGHNCSSGEY
jgi:hypothetical protein